MQVRTSGKESRVARRSISCVGSSGTEPNATFSLPNRPIHDEAMQPAQYTSSSFPTFYGKIAFEFEFEFPTFYGKITVDTL